MRQDRPSLRDRFAALDAELARPATTRTLATALGALLLLQGAVVVDRTAAGPDAPEIAALAAANGATVATTGDPDPVAPAAPPIVGPATAPATVPATGTGAAGDAPAADADDTTAADPADHAGIERGPATGVGTTTAPARQTASAAATPAQQRFASLFPSQAQASQSTAQPATTRWAVLIGINEHRGRTRDNVGSRQDAEILAKHLRSLGWRDDHIVLLTDGTATRDNIIEAFRWLQRKTDGNSVVAVHYSGHVKQWPGRDVDGDGEVPDEALWPSDNAFITDGEVGTLLGRVRAARLWFNVGGCEAAGFNDWGTTGPGRIVTWSSAEHQKSYEEPSRKNSVWGFYLVQAGMIWGHADADGDGDVTVEEAFRYATPRAHDRTRGQSHGPQTPAVSDRFTGEFDLRIPPPPRPRSQPQSSSSDDGPSCLLCPGTALASGRPR